MAGAAQANRARRDAGVAVLGDSSTSTGPAQFGVIQAVAPMLRVEVNAFNKRDADEIERTITAFAQSPNGGLIITPGGSAFTHRDLIIGLAARYKLPAVYFERLFVVAGGLLSYGPDRTTCIGARLATSIASSRARSR